LYSSNDDNENDSDSQNRIMGFYDAAGIVLDGSNDTGGFFIERTV
jgi:hypothetical protein